MPVTVKLDWQTEISRDASGGTIPLRANIHGAGSSDLAAWQALRDWSPLVYLGLLRQSIAVTCEGPNFHKGVVTYASSGMGGTDTPAGTEFSPATTPPGAPAPSPATPTAPLGAGYEFSFTSEMQHRTQAIRTRFGRIAGDGDFQGGAYTASEFGGAADYRGAVGVSRSGGSVRVEGYDVPVPSSTWTRTVMVAPMTLVFKDKLESIVGKISDAPFYNSQAGEELLWGVNGRLVEDVAFSLNFTFHKKKNKTNFVVSPDPTDTGFPYDHTKPGALVLPFVGGWDHVWVIYAEALGDNELVSRPIYAYAAQVIEEADFSQLMIGT